MKKSLLRIASWAPARCPAVRWLLSAAPWLKASACVILAMTAPSVVFLASRWTREAGRDGAACGDVRHERDVAAGNRLPDAEVPYGERLAQVIGRLQEARARLLRQFDVAQGQIIETNIEYLRRLADGESRTSPGVRDALRRLEERQRKKTEIADELSGVERTLVALASVKPDRGTFPRHDSPSTDLECEARVVLLESGIREDRIPVDVSEPADSLTVIPKR